MPRTARAAVGGLVYHALNRGNNRQKIFRRQADYAAFVKLLIEGKQRAKVRVLAYCLMGDHWHLVLVPARAGDLAAYLAWVTNTHAKRHRAQYSGSSGHVYQGRYKSFVVQQGVHLLKLLRYVEANPLRAGRVRRAQDWPWSSLGCDDETAMQLLSDWPIDRPAKWTALVNRPLAEKDLSAVRTSVRRGRPWGDQRWTQRMAGRLGVMHTLRPPGRPRKQ